MTLSDTLRIRQQDIYDTVKNLGEGASQQEIVNVLRGRFDFDDRDLIELAPLLQMEVFGLDDGLMLPHQHDVRTPAPTQELPVVAPPPLHTPASVRDDARVFVSLVGKLGVYGDACQSRQTAGGLEIQLNSSLSVADCQPLLTELGIETKRVGRNGFVVRASDAAKLDEHIVTETAVLSRLNERFSNDFKDSHDGAWGVRIEAGAPGVYRIDVPSHTDSVHLKAGYSLHMTMGQVDKILHLKDNPTHETWVTPRRWNAHATSEDLRGRNALLALEQVLLTAGRQKGMLDVAFKNARLSRSDLVDLDVIEVVAPGSKPLCDFLQKAQEKDAAEGKNTFVSQCEKLGCAPEDVIKLQGLAGQVVISGSVQVRTDSDMFKNELNALFRAFGIKAANGLPKTDIDSAAAQTIEPGRFIWNLGWFEPNVIDRYFSLEYPRSQESQSAPVALARTRHGLEPRTFGADSEVQRVQTELRQKVGLTAQALARLGQDMVGAEKFKDADLREVKDINLLGTAVCNDTYATANHGFMLTDRGLRLGHDTLSTDERRSLCYGSAYARTTPNPEDPTQRQSRLDALQAKLLNSATIRAQQTKHRYLLASINAMFDSAKANNRAVGALGGGASYYSLELFTEALESIEVITARILQADAGDTSNADGIERFAAQMAGISDLWSGCAEGLSQKCRPLVAAINSSVGGTGTLETSVAQSAEAFLELYTNFCTKVQRGVSRNESSMQNQVGAFDHIIGRGTARAAGSGWGRREATVNDETCRAVLKVNVPVDQLLKTALEKEYLPELKSIRAAWEKGRAIESDWESLLDSLSCTADEKRELRSSDEFAFESVPRFNQVEWLMPILVLRHLIRAGLVERSPGNIDSVYSRFIMRYESVGGHTRHATTEREQYGRTSYQEASNVSGTSER